MKSRLKLITKYNIFIKTLKIYQTETNQLVYIALEVVLFGATRRRKLVPVAYGTVALVAGQVQLDVLAVVLLEERRRLAREIVARLAANVAKLLQR